MAFVQIRSRRDTELNLTADNDIATPIVRFSRSYNWFDIIVEHTGTANTKNIMFQGFVIVDP